MVQHTKCCNRVVKLLRADKTTREAVLMLDLQIPDKVGCDQVAKDLDGAIQNCVFGSNSVYSTDSFSIAANG